MLACPGEGLPGARPGCACPQPGSRATPGGCWTGWAAPTAPGRPARPRRPGYRHRQPGSAKLRAGTRAGARQAGLRPSPGRSRPPGAAGLTGPPRAGGCCDHVVDAAGEELLRDQRMQGVLPGQAAPLLIPRTQHVPQVGSGPSRRCGTRRNGEQPDRRRPTSPGSGRLPAERAPDRPLIGRIRSGTSGPSAACPWSAAASVLITDLIPEWTQFEAFLDEQRQRSQPLPGRADPGASTPVAGAVPDHAPRPGQARGFVEKVWFDETITHRPRGDRHPRNARRVVHR